MFEKPKILTGFWVDMYNNPEHRNMIIKARDLLRDVLRDSTLDFAFATDDAESACLGIYQNTDSEWEVLTDWNELSAYGLLIALNHIVFHPKGWAISRNPKTGVSGGILLDNTDRRWVFDDATLEEGKLSLITWGLWPSLSAQYEAATESAIVARNSITEGK